jgi:hypothetical protein
MTTAIDILQDPEQAIAEINNHDHTGGCGNHIPSDGLQDGAVTTTKIQNGAVSGAKIAPLTVTNDNIADGTIEAVKLTAEAITSLSGGAGLLGVTKYIGSGLKLQAPLNSLSVNVQAGDASIGMKKHEVTVPVPVTLNANKAALIYAQYSQYTETPTIDKYEAQYPALEADHVVRYIFNNKVNDTTILDTTANHNDLTCFGGCTLVDGWADKSIKVDGTTGYMMSASNANFPVGATVRTATIIFTLNALPSGNDGYLLTYGTNAAGQMFEMYVSTTGQIGVNVYGSASPLNFILTVGQTYMFTVGYDGTKFLLYINGYFVGSVTLACNTVLHATYRLSVGRINYSASYWTFATFHYVDIRNTLMPQSKIAQLANKALFPCNYKLSAAQYPTIGRTEYHEYRFDDVSGTTVTDTGVTSTQMNGVAGALNTIVPSTIGLGNARNFVGAATTGITFSYPMQVTANGFTIVSVFKPVDDGKYKPIFSNRDGDSAGSGKGASLQIENTAGTGRLMFVDNGNSTLNYSVGKVQYGQLNFAAVTIDGSNLTFYLNSPQPDSTIKFTMTANGGSVMPNYAIGKLSPLDACWFNGVIEYVLVIPNVALTQEEIEQIYNSLMGGRIVSFVDDTIPADAISLGFVRTNSLRVIEVDDSSYRYGRNETPFPRGGNKRVFLGWFWADAGVVYNIPHPLGTAWVKVDFVNRKLMTEEFWLDVNNDVINSSGSYGMWVNGVNPLYLRIRGGTNDVTYSYNSYDDAITAAAWIGIFVELQ